MSGFKPQEILCLVDLSTASRLVLCWARIFAQGFASRIEVLHVSEPPPFVIEGQEQAQLEVTKTELFAAVATLAQETLGKHASYHIVVEEGHPVQVVMDRLQRHTPGLIVMGSHGHDGMARVLMGSVAENVVRVARCPMLIVRGAEPADGPKQIICPVELSAPAVDCLETAGILATVLRSKLEIVTARQDQAIDGAAEAELHARVPEGLRRMCSVKETILRGDPAERIVERLRAGAADLVVLGAEHRKFLEFTTLGRTTERVVRFSPCTVMLIPQAKAPDATEVAPGKSIN